MKLEKKRELYLESKKTIYEYNIQEVVSINDSGILFSDGRSIDFAECRTCFSMQHPHGRQYIGARFLGEFWQFFTNNSCIIILCDNLDESLKILSHIGFANSFDLS